MIGLFGIVSEPSHSLDDLIQLWRRPGFIIYFSMIEFIIVSLLVASSVVEQILKRDAKADLMAGNLHHHHRRHRPHRFRSASTTGSILTNSERMGYGNNHNIQQQTSSSWTSCYSRMISARLQQRNMTPAKIKIMLGISYGCVSGLLSSQTLLIAKSAIELLMLTILEGDNQFENPLSWFLVVALISAALLQVCFCCFFVPSVRLSLEQREGWKKKLSWNAP